MLIIVFGLQIYKQNLDFSNNYQNKFYTFTGVGKINYGYQDKL